MRAPHGRPPSTARKHTAPNSCRLRCAAGSRHALSSWRTFDRTPVAPSGACARPTVPSIMDGAFFSLCLEAKAKLTSRSKSISDPDDNSLVMLLLHPEMDLTGTGSLEMKE